MTAPLPVDPGLHALAVETFTKLLVNAYPEGTRRVVRLAGELDLATRDQVVITSTGGDRQPVTIDLTRVTFMDCGGYGSLVASRLALEGAGRTLHIRGATGQPVRLLHLLAELERSVAASP